MQSFDKYLRYLKLTLSLFLIAGILTACSDDDERSMNPASPDFTPIDVISHTLDNIFHDKFTDFTATRNYLKV